MTLRLSPNALRVLHARYLRRDAGGHVRETPDELFERVAHAIADAELLLGRPSAAREWESTFHDLLTSLDFLPNSPTLMNAGTALGQLSACFVLPVEDSMEGIFDAVKLMALVQRTGGGTGFSFSRLRPQGSIVASTGGVASGPVSFMRIFDCATENIQLGGRRRGANMGVLRVDHPDILSFIDAKRDGSLAAFNLSVGVTDSFMDAVRARGTYELRHPATDRHAGERSAHEVFQALVDAAWETGDPGVLFLDAIARANPVPQLGTIEATNPCGEVPLLPYESCNLGSVNLAHMLAARRGKPAVDFARLARTVRHAVRFLDDVIEVGRYPHDAIERATLRTRKLGLGAMGFAELLIRLGIPYGSPASGRLAERIMWCIRRTARRASAELAAERGPYPAWEQSRHAAQGLRLRNATLTAIAPTGTIGIIADTTASIEPLFAVAYRRSHVLGDQTFIEIPRVVREACEREGVELTEILEWQAHAGVPPAAGLPGALRRVLVTALEASPEDHLRIQAAFQRFTDNSVSKTVNLPQTATREEIARTLMGAWTMGLKGVTVYRYGSKSAQVLELGLGEEPFHLDHASRCDPTECRL